MTTPSFRIAAGQPVATKAKQSLMIGSQELEMFVYRQPYHLGHASQREALLHTLEAEFGRTAELPTLEASTRLVVYLVVVDDEPILIPEVEVLPWVFGYVFAKAGREVAQRVSYRSEMLTESTP